MNTKPSGPALFAPGLFRLFLASVVVLQHAHLIALGHWAVYVFFILSGYWVAAMWTAKYRHCRTPYLTFIVSRFWRLLPLYLVCVAMACAVTVRFSAQGAEVVKLLHSPAWVVRELVLLGSAMQKAILPPAWSLDVELQFYLVAPFAIALVALGAKRGAWFPKFIAAVLIAGTAAAVLFGEDLHLGRYCGFFLVGLLLYQSGWNPGRMAGCVSLGITALATCALLLIPATHDWIGPAATAGAWTPLHLPNQVICVAFAFSIVPYVAYSLHVRSSRLDRHFGNIAYPLYLFHYVVKLFVENGLHRLQPGSAAALAVDFTIVAIGTLALYLLVDLPFEKWRKRFVDRRVVAVSQENR